MGGISGLLNVQFEVGHSGGTGTAGINFVGSKRGLILTPQEPLGLSSSSSSLQYSSS
jgi:hypothetical protein